MDILEETTDLSVDERSELERNERIIAGGLQTFYDVGHALAEIRDRKLYRARFRTFEAYCQDRWGFSRQRASQLIIGADVAENLSTVVDKTGLLEVHARELASVPPNEQRLVYQLAHELTEGDITQSAIRSLAAVANGVIASGYVEVEEGVQKPWTSLEPEEKRSVLMANLERETYERMQQHKARKSLSKQMDEPMIERVTLPKEQVKELRRLVREHAPEEARRAYTEKWRDRL